MRIMYGVKTKVTVGSIKMLHLMRCQTYWQGIKDAGNIQGVHGFTLIFIHCSFLQ